MAKNDIIFKKDIVIFKKDLISVAGRISSVQSDILVITGMMNSSGELVMKLALEQLANRLNKAVAELAQLGKF